MVPALAAICAAIMMAFAALRGFRRNARLIERLYSVATGGWSALGAAIYIRPSMADGPRSVWPIAMFSSRSSDSAWSFWACLVRPC